MDEVVVVVLLCVIQDLSPPIFGGEEPSPSRMGTVLVVVVLLCLIQDLSSLRGESGVVSSLASLGARDELVAVSSSPSASDALLVVVPSTKFSESVGSRGDVLYSPSPDEIDGAVDDTPIVVLATTLGGSV